jgi:molybdenum cofactor cytidylyltransferase
VRFGPVPPAEALGAINAHTLRAGDRVVKKGRVIDPADVAALEAAGVAAVVVARLDAGELGEDAAAAAVAAAVAGPGVRVDPADTGRANLFAAHGGVVVVDASRIHALNQVDEAITAATLPVFAAVPRGAMVATVKLIAFGARDAAVAAAADAGARAVEVRGWKGIAAGLVLTRTEGTSARVLDRAAAVPRERLARVDGALIAERRVAHAADAVAAAIRELLALHVDVVLVLGASAVMDRDDVIPAGIRAAGGAVTRVGMPVDPGNLLVLGAVGASAVIGVPGCARSLKRSGFDAVLERLAAGLVVTGEDLIAMGVGGLLEEVPTRPRPRAGASEGEGGGGGGEGAARMAAVVLAAGRASRMGSNKLLAVLDGKPLVRHAVEAALGSRAEPVVVVTGNQADEVRAALAGLDVAFVHNADYAAGMSTSLRAGVAAVTAADPAIGGALVCLGDMPRVRAAHLDAIIDGVRDDHVLIVVPTFERKRGNPVLLTRALFDEVAALDGDVGARALIERHAASVRWLPLEEPGILVDVDTPGALEAIRSRD